MRTWAKAVKCDVLAIYLGMRDPRVPWIAKVLAGIVVAYAFSPIDLIPDFIPVLGLLDDFVLLPIGIWLVIRLIPKSVIDDLRRQAVMRRASEMPRSLAAAVVIVLLWCLTVGIAVYCFARISGIHRA